MGSDRLICQNCANLVDYSVDRLTEALEAVMGVADTFDRNAKAYECGAEAGSNEITQANCLRSAAHIIRGQITSALTKEDT